MYLHRLVNDGFLEEAAGSTPKRKMYQVAERFYNIYYLMRFSRSGKRRLTWLVQAMRVLYSEADFQTWTDRTLDSWKNSDEPGKRADHEAFLYSLAVLLRESEKVKGAETAYLKAIEIDPNYEYAWFGLGRLFHLYSERDEDAEKAYRKAIDLAPNKSFPLIFLASLLFKNGRDIEAEPLAQQAFTLEPSGLWARHIFLIVLGKNTAVWRQIIPCALDGLKTETVLTDSDDPADNLYSFAVHGLEILLSSKTISFREAADLIVDSGADDILEPILIALRAADDKTVLIKASPEHRAFAKDFLEKIRPLELPS